MLASSHEDQESRRIDLALLAAAALLARMVALVGAVAGRTERVPRL